MLEHIVTTLETVTLTACIAVAVMGIVGYLYWLRPTQQRASELYERASRLTAQLAVERQLREYIRRWIAIEAKHYKVPAVQEALEERIKEQLEMLERIEQRRQGIEWLEE